MQGKFRTKEQSLTELERLRQRITELEESQKTLKQVERKYQDIFENCIEGIYQTTLEGRFIGANPSAARLLGYDSPEDLINSVTDIGTQVYAYPEDRERAIGVLKERGVFENFEMRYRKKDGGIAWGLHNLRFVRDEQGNVAYIEGTFQNITDRKQMEEALKQSEQRFRSLSEASLEAILFIEDGIIVDANEALNLLHGYDGENLRGRVATDFIAPELRDISKERVRTRTEGIYETLGLRKDGSAFPVEINAREIEIDGRRIRVTATRDLTERKKIEKQLRDYQEQLEKLVEERTNELKESEKKYRNIFENAQEGIFQSTPDGRFVSANPALALMFGSETPEELVALINDIPEQIYVDRAKRSELAYILARVGVVRNFELQFRCKDGTIKDASMNARVVRDEQGTMLYYEGTVQDITEKKQAEKALEVERGNLKEANNALMEANVALKVLLKHISEDKRELEERFLLNVQHLVMPHVERLKKSILDPVQQISFDLIASNLYEITSPFLNVVQDFKFSPRQLEIVTLIKDGKTSKEIASLLRISKRAVDIQRFLIRKKLGLNKEKANMQVYLKSLS
jgi:PAS domain S-box-containing protein